MQIAYKECSFDTFELEWTIWNI